MLNFLSFHWIDSLTYRACAFLQHLGTTWFSRPGGASNQNNIELVLHLQRPAACSTGRPGSRSVIFKTSSRFSAPQQPFPSDLISVSTLKFCSSELSTFIRSSSPLQPARYLGLSRRKHNQCQAVASYLQRIQRTSLRINGRPWRGFNPSKLPALIST